LAGSNCPTGTSAERQTSEAEFHRKRAQHEADFAKQQLSIVQQRTRESELERERAKRNAQDARAITTAMLELNIDAEQSPAELKARKRMAAAAVQTLSRLKSEGYSDPSLTTDLENFQGMFRKYEASNAGLSTSPPAEWQFHSSPEDEFQAGTDKTDTTMGTTAYITSMRDSSRGKAMLYQMISAEDYAGKRVRLSASLQSKSLETRGGLVLSTVDPADPHPHEGVNFFLQNPLRGTNGWSRHQIVADIPANSEWLTIGFSLTDAGTIWADNFILEIVDTSVPLTSQGPRTPLDLDFEGRK
jgi:hypothetical protein